MLRRKRKSKWAPPNHALQRDAFATDGGYHLWNAVLDIREHLSKIEGVLVLLIPLTLAIIGAVASLHLS